LLNFCEKSVLCGDEVPSVFLFTLFSQKSVTKKLLDINRFAVYIW